MWSLSHSHWSTNPEFKSLATKAWDTLLKRSDLGFLKLHEREDLWTNATRRGHEMRKHSKILAIIGMGGSSLGSRALEQACQDMKLSYLRLEFFDNVDGWRFEQRLEKMAEAQELKDVHWAIISKSGNTIETLNMVNRIDVKLKENGLKLEENATVITENRSNPLFNWAKEANVEILDLPVDVGGRFSVFTSVGLFPAAFMGLSLEDLRKGIKNALNNRDLVVELAAQTLMSFERKQNMTVFWPYCDDLKEFGSWAIQLWAESLGKRIDRAGKPAKEASTPLCYVGASDQHSVLQQVAEGAQDKFVWFLRVNRSEKHGESVKETLFPSENQLLGKSLGALLKAEAQATIESLAEAGVKSLGLSVEHLNEEATAELMMLSMLTVGVLGECLDINAFDQPGVEAGKKRAKELLRKG